MGQECITTVAKCLITLVWKGESGCVGGEWGLQKRKKYPDFKDGGHFCFALVSL